MDKDIISTDSLQTILTTPKIPMPNSLALDPKQPKFLWVAAQGDLNQDSGLYRFDVTSQQAQQVVTQYQGQSFNSLNDLALDNTGGIWFTDPDYGYEQKFRPKPKLRNSVWHYNTENNKLTALVQDVLKPNGIALAANAPYFFITDSSIVNGDGSHNPKGKRRVIRYRYKFQDGAPVITAHKTLISFDEGIPDGIKVDPYGNIWVAYGKGVFILTPNGKPLGELQFPASAVNLTFAKRAPNLNDIFITADKHLYQLRWQLKDS